MKNEKGGWGENENKLEMRLQIKIKKNEKTKMENLFLRWKDQSGEFVFEMQKVSSLEWSGADCQFRVERNEFIFGKVSIPCVKRYRLSTSSGE